MRRLGDEAAACYLLQPDDSSVAPSSSGAHWLRYILKLLPLRWGIAMLTLKISLSMQLHI